MTGRVLLVGAGVIAGGTRPTQKVALATLRDFIERAAALASPAIIVVGEVAAFAAWQTCAQAGSRRLAGADAQT
jgi:siroheme synthase